jgi:hypothetical protein
MKIYFFNKEFNKTDKKEKVKTINIYDNLDPENNDEIMISFKDKKFEILNNSFQFTMNDWDSLKINGLEPEEFVDLILEKGKKDSLKEFIYPKNILIKINENIILSF